MRHGNNKMNHLHMILASLSIVSFMAAEREAASVNLSHEKAFGDWMPGDLPVEARRFYWGIVIERLELAIAAASSKDAKRALKGALKVAKEGHMKSVRLGALQTRWGALDETRVGLMALRKRAARVEDTRAGMSEVVDAIKGATLAMKAMTGGESGEHEAARPRIEVSAG